MGDEPTPMAAVPPGDDVPADVPAEALAESAPEGEAVAESATPAELTAEEVDYLATLQRVQAEYLNFRKRVGREKDDVRFAAARDFCAAMLPVLDNLERALSAKGDADTLHQGVEMILGEFETALSQLGVTRIGTDGERFDPDRHEAIGMVPTDDAEPGTIVNEVQRGFSYQGRVLRAPRVQVAAKPPDPHTDAAADGDAAGDTGETD
jgi:molecular chaperone GrpE